MVPTVPTVELMPSWAVICIINNAWHVKTAGVFCSLFGLGGNLAIHSRAHNQCKPCFREIDFGAVEGTHLLREVIVHEVGVVEAVRLYK